MGSHVGTCMNKETTATSHFLIWISPKEPFSVTTTLSFLQNEDFFACLSRNVAIVIINYNHVSKKAKVLKFKS